MVSIAVPYVQCDFCPARARKETEQADNFHVIDNFDLCPDCFEQVFDPISRTIGDVWRSLKSDDGQANGRAIVLMGKVVGICIHEHVGSAETDFTGLEDEYDKALEGPGTNDSIRS